MDWRDITDEKEKYAAYLCSREWSEKKEAVKQRAGGKCERCFVNLIDAVHHLTYARKYKEELNDLQGICQPCHEFTHGKIDQDPRVPSFPVTMAHSSESSLLVCPICGSHNIHIDGVKQPKHDHDAIVILELWSECGHSFDLRLQTHKGSTECFIERLRRSTDV